jgi:hypothetical protein
MQLERRAPDAAAARVASNARALKNQLAIGAVDPGRREILAVALGELRHLGAIVAQHRDVRACLAADAATHEAVVFHSFLRAMRLARTRTSSAKRLPSAFAAWPGRLSISRPSDRYAIVGSSAIGLSILPEAMRG